MHSNHDCVPPSNDAGPYETPEQGSVQCKISSNSLGTFLRCLADMEEEWTFAKEKNINALSARADILRRTLNQRISQLHELAQEETQCILNKFELEEDLRRVSVYSVLEDEMRWPLVLTMNHGMRMYFAKAFREILHYFLSGYILPSE